MLHDELDGFTVVAVALDVDAEAARAVIHAAEPTYPCLIDDRHLVAELYGMVNVPSAVWIDEDGRIVRSTEIAGTNEAWREHMDRETGRMTPEGIVSVREDRVRYLDAIRAWVREGRHALADARLPEPSEDDALAAAHFRLAVYLREAGRQDAARRHFDEAVRLRPASWNFRRQSWQLEGVQGDRFWSAVDELAPGEYYPPVELEA